jgi:hypothetical protein
MTTDVRGITTEMLPEIRSCSLRRGVVGGHVIGASVRDVPHMSASSMKQARRNSQASFPVSVGGSEKPSWEPGESVPFGSDWTSVDDAADGFCVYRASSTWVLLSDTMLRILDAVARRGALGLYMMLSFSHHSSASRM